MKDKIAALGGSIAWLASSTLGPRIAFAPDDDKGGGDDGDKGGGGDDKGAAGNPPAGGDDKAAPAPRGNLFDRVRKAAPGADDADKAAKPEGDGKPGADGRPAHIPEKYWDKEKKALNADALLKSNAELEAAHGKLKREKSIGGEVPETAEAYFPEGLKLDASADRFGEAVTVDDPGLKSWAAVCKKYSIGKELAADLARDMFASMNKFAPAPIDPDQEEKALGPNAAAIIEGVQVWIDAGVESGRLSDDDALIADDLARTAKGIAFLRSMRQMSGADPLPIVPGGGVSSMSEVQWNEEYKAAVQARDYAKQERLDALGAQLFGTAAGGAARGGGYDPEKRFDKAKR